jgi:hypothetical protein
MADFQELPKSPAWLVSATLWRRREARPQDRDCRTRTETVTHGRRFRIDTTVVETNVHYPTDSTLLRDGVRVLTRTMQRATLGDPHARVRNRLPGRMSSLPQYRKSFYNKARRF